MSQDWKYSLCSCCDTPAICLWAWCIPGGSLCMQVMAVSNVSDMSDAGLFAYFAVYCFGVFGAAFNRFTIREKLDIKGNIILDFFCLCCCDICSTVQEYRQVMALKHGDDKRPPWMIR